VVGKAAVFGLLKRNSKFYTLAVHNTQTAPLLSIIRDPVKYDIITHTDVIKAMMC
jgi:IS1016 transposase